MTNPLIQKDFCKLDVYRFDIEHISDDLYDLNINNAISWDMINLKVTKSELVGLADFINKMVENK
jgi:hypothetical protein